MPLPPRHLATTHWTPREDGRVRCDVCPRGCSLGEGQRGYCYVRANAGGEIVLMTHGRSRGFCVDPIEKKPLHHFLPGTPCLSFGTAGCNLGCRFCQNWDISKSREADADAAAASPAAITALAEETGCRSIAFTYNDPVIFMEYAMAVARACRPAGIRTVAVTAGYVNPPARAEFFEHVDAANVDLKAFSDEFYRTYVRGSLEPVLNTLCYIRHETNTWLEITNLLIPGLNDDDEDLEAMSTWIVQNLGTDVPLHFTAFHPDWKLRDRPATPSRTLSRARQIAAACGVRYVYTGNVRDPEGESTWCFGCGSELIGRDGYAITYWQLDPKARCRTCGDRCPGWFESAHGRWGNRRLPVLP